MQFKKILVFAMALLVLVSACTPAIYATSENATDPVRATLQGKATGTENLQDAEDALNLVAGLAEGNYDEVIARGYAYIEENGYLEAVVDAVNKAVAAIECVDLDNLEIPNDLKEELQLKLSAVSIVLEEIATTLAEHTVEKLQNLGPKLYALKNELLGCYENVYDVCSRVSENFVVDVYRVMEVAKKEVEFAVNALCETLAAKVAEYIGMTKDMIYNASHGKYELTDDSLYVALGDATYVKDLAALLHLSKKYQQFGLADNYLDALVGADLVTIKFNNGELLEFAGVQTRGVIAEIVRSNGQLMTWCNNEIIGEEVVRVISTYGIDLNAHPMKLEWDNYLSTNAQAVLNSVLAELKLELLEQGVPEYYYIDINPEVEKALVDRGLGLPGVALNIEPIKVPLADLVVYYCENALYSYVQFTERTLETLNKVYEVAPNATVIITGIDNPFNTELTANENVHPAIVQTYNVINDVIDGLNAQLYVYALLHEKTIFVNSENAVDIHNAINVHCNHVYDNCVDVNCNRCTEAREAPGHTFVNYVSNNDATCTSNATGTAKCEYCSTTNTKTLPNTTLPHEWKNATCTDPETCKDCGKVRGDELGHDYTADCDPTCNRCEADRKADEHLYSGWDVIKEATESEEGIQQRKCYACKCVETEKIPVVEPHVCKRCEKLTIAVMVLSVACVGLTIAVCYLFKKTREK